LVALEIQKYVIFASHTTGNPRTLRVPGTGVKSFWSDGGSSFCITAGSSVALVNGTFAHGLDSRALRVNGLRTSVFIKQCRFQGNDVTPGKREGGALYVDDTARVDILSSSFIGNTSEQGGAITARGSSHVNMMSEKALGKCRRSAACLECSSPASSVRHDRQSDCTAAVARTRAIADMRLTYVPP
jgi:predicted outer membrane repeat protein